MCTTDPCPARAKRPARRTRGFSLIELIFFIVVVSVGLAGVLRVFHVGVASSADPMVRKQAVALAESILQEVLQKAYTDPDPAVTSGESTRDTFDDVDDYNGRGNAAFSDLPASLSSYTISISVTTSTLGAVPAKRVAVTVARGAESVTLAGWRTSY